MFSLPLYYHYITHWVICQGVLEKFLKNFCGILRSTRTIFELTCTAPSPLDTNSIPHFGQNVNSQNAQSLRKKIIEIVHFAEKPALAFVSARRKCQVFLEKFFLLFCTKF
jgi:hypothetical protein